MKNLPQATLLALTTLLHAPLDAQEKRAPADFVTVWTGTLPIILSAPHGGREPVPGIPLRRGVGVAQFTTERDNNTAELAELVAGNINEQLRGRPFVVIAKFERKYIDANRLEAAAYESPEAKSYYDAYHRAIMTAAGKIRQIWSRGLLLDLHGQGAEVDSVFRGTDNGKSVSAMQQRFGREALIGPKSIFGQLALKGYKINPSGSNDRERLYTGGHTTRFYGSRQRGGIDAIQLEFGTNLRSKNNLARTAEDLAQAIEVFSRAYLPLDERRPKQAAGIQP
jgi:N-formylglutamate amidohydrolase